MTDRLAAGPGPVRHGGGGADRPVGRPVTHVGDLPQPARPADGGRAVPPAIEHGEDEVTPSIGEGLDGLCRRYEVMLVTCDAGEETRRRCSMSEPGGEGGATA